MAIKETTYERVFYIEHSNSFKSYDLYDGSSFAFLGLERFEYAKLTSTYLNKFSPFNLRTALKIKKRLYPHSLACIVNAYYNKPVGFITECEIKKISEWLISQSLIKKYGFHCWNGLGVSMVMRGVDVNPEVPGLIGTAAITKSLIARYKKYKETRIKEILESVRQNLLTNHFVIYNRTPFLKYKPSTEPWKFTINASAIGASLIAEITSILKDDCGVEEVINIVNSIINNQKKDGSWLYTVDLKTGKHKQQYDFHQAYIVKSLMEIEKTELFADSLEKPILKGIKYHNDKQLMSNGQIYYRLPKKYPANIHNQLYGYYINKVASKRYGTEFNDVADLIYQWTYSNLYNDSTGFIYGKYPCCKINIPYSRWGNSHYLLIQSSESLYIE